MFRLLIVSAWIARVALGIENVTIEDHPYHLALLYKDEYICGASLVTYTQALTAQSCTSRKNVEDLKVRAGASCPNCDEGQVLQVLIKCEHRNYAETNKDYDIAVLFLSPLEKYLPEIQPIPIQPRGADVTPATSGSVVSWRFDPKQTNELLQKIEVVKISKGQCNQAVYPRQITDGMSCHTIFGSSNCRGDFGSGQVIDGKLFGVASWGSNKLCGDNNHPSVFTKLASDVIADFIDECTASFTP